MNEQPPAVLGMRFVITFAVLAIGPVLVWDMLRAAGIDVAAFSAQQRQEYGMIGFVVACAAIAGFTWLQPPAANWRPLPLGRVLRSYGLFLLAWLPLLVGYLQVAHAIGHGLVPQASLAYVASGDASRPGFWLVVFGIVIAAPVAEEIVFRGFLQGALQAVLPRWAAIGIAAAGFGIVHTLPYALPVGLLGILFGWLFARCGSLLPSMVAHALHNLITVLVTFAWPGHIELLYPN